MKTQNISRVYLPQSNLSLILSFSNWVPKTHYPKKFYLDNLSPRFFWTDCLHVLVTIVKDIFLKLILVFIYILLISQIIWASLFEFWNCILQLVFQDNLVLVRFPIWALVGTLQLLTRTGLGWEVWTKPGVCCTDGRTNIKYSN